MRLQIYIVLAVLCCSLQILDTLPVHKGITCPLKCKYPARCHLLLGVIPLCHTSSNKYYKTDVVKVPSLSGIANKDKQKGEEDVSNDKDEHVQECEEIFMNKHRPKKNLQPKKTPQKNKKCTSQNEKQNTDKGIGNGRKEKQESLKEKGRPFTTVESSNPKAPAGNPCPIKCKYGLHCYMAMGVIPMCPKLGGLNRYGRR